MKKFKCNSQDGDTLQFNDELKRCVNIEIQNGGLFSNYKEVYLSNQDGIKLAVSILDNCTDSENKFEAPVIYGKIEYTGIVVGSDNTIVKGSLIQFADGATTIMHAEDGVKGFTSPVVPESVVCISHKLVANG